MQRYIEALDKGYYTLINVLLHDKLKVCNRRYPIERRDGRLRYNMLT